VHEHLDSEFADAALWLRELPGAREGLRALADTGVRLGIISNADGLIGQRLAEMEIVQVGSGIGVALECLIDSGAVGVMKPDPKIFHLALDAMGIDAGDAWYVGDMPGIDVIGARAAGLFPVLMDPYQFHLDADYARVSSLDDLAGIVANA
jgi:putative hydrolase of the HAD superfamily